MESCALRTTTQGALEPSGKLPPPHSSCNMTSFSAQPLTLMRPVLLDDIRNTLNSSLHAGLDTSCWQGPLSWRIATEDIGAQGSEGQMQAGTQECAQPSEPSF